MGSARGALVVVHQAAHFSGKATDSHRQASPGGTVDVIGVIAGEIELKLEPCMMLGAAV